MLPLPRSGSRPSSALPTAGTVSEASASGVGTASSGRWSGSQARSGTSPSPTATPGGPASACASPPRSGGARCSGSASTTASSCGHDRIPHRCRGGDEAHMGRRGFEEGGGARRMRVMREGRRLHRAGWIRRLLSLAGLLGLLGTGSPAIAADACSFDAATATVTASVSGFTPETSLRNTMAVSGVAILFEGERCGEATTTNTDTIMVTGSGRDDVLVVDIRSGPFAPGATPDPDGSSEIEFNVDLGGGPDLLRIFGTRGPDRIVVGSSGVNLDGDAAANITTTRMAVLVFGLGRDDVLNGRGGAGTGGGDES